MVVWFFLGFVGVMVICFVGIFAIFEVMSRLHRYGERRREEGGGLMYRPLPVGRFTAFVAWLICAGVAGFVGAGMRPVAVAEWPDTVRVKALEIVGKDGNTVAHLGKNADGEPSFFISSAEGLFGISVGADGPMLSLHGAGGDGVMMSSSLASVMFTHGEHAGAVSLGDKGTYRFESWNRESGPEEGRAAVAWLEGAGVRAFGPDGQRVGALGIDDKGLPYLMLGYPKGDTFGVHLGGERPMMAIESMGGGRVIVGADKDEPTFTMYRSEVVGEVALSEKGKMSMSGGLLPVRRE